MDGLMALLGTWTGEGTAFFPTIDQQDYLEQFSFALDEVHQVIQYEQKTWRKPNQQLLHWEFGFIRVLEDGSVLLTNTQNNGRLEVMTGQMTPHPNGFRLTLLTSTFSNDARMHQAAREWLVEGDTLTYTLAMATQTVPEFQPHLRAVVRRC